MKKIAFILSFVALLLASCQKESNKYTVTGTNVPAELNGKMIYISTMDSLLEKHIKIDSAMIENGAFKLEGEFTFGPSIATLSFNQWWEINPRQQPIEFILEPSDITILYDSIFSVVKGEYHNIEFQKIKSSENDLREFYNQQRPLRKAAKGDFAKTEELRLEGRNKSDAHNAKVIEFIKNIDNSRIGVMSFINNYYGFEPETRLELISLFPEEYRLTKWVAKIKESTDAEIATAEGKPYRDVVGKTTEAKELSLSEVLAKNEYVLLDFWASWCGPCIGEIPNMKKAYEAFHKKGFEIFGASADEREKDWLSALDEHKMPWIHVKLDGAWDSQGMRDYGVQGIPHTVLIAKDGTIVAKNIRGDELSHKLQELLK